MQVINIIMLFAMGFVAGRFFKTQAMQDYYMDGFEHGYMSGYFNGRMDKEFKL